MRHIFAIFVVALLFGQTSAFAEDVTFIKEYSYQASEADSKLSARAIALEQVKRLLLEELGTYLISETEVKNFQLTKDKITTLSAGIVATQILEDNWNGETYYLKAKIKADPNEVTKALDTLRKDKHKEKELEDSKKRADEALAELARLKKELEILKGDKLKQAEYKTAANVLRLKDWFEKGYNHAVNKDYDEAIEAYTSAITLDPNFAGAYYNRGVNYSRKGQNDRAIEDYSRTIAIVPFPEAYINRGLIYRNKGKYDKAIEDYTKAITLNPNLAQAYINRGFAYADKGQYDRVIEDYNKVIALNPDEGFAYSFRGIAYAMTDNTGRAISDFQKACDLGFEQGCELLQTALSQMRWKKQVE